MFPEMHFAPGVDLRDMTPQTLLACQCVAVACAEQGVKCVVTSLKRPGLFAKMGFHATGNAVDFRMRDIPPAVAERIWDRLNRWIGRPGGGQYDVVNELRPGSSPNWTGPHIHIEFDPK